MTVGLELPVVALRNSVLFPGGLFPVEVGRAKSRRAIEVALSGDRQILLAVQKDPDLDDPLLADLYPVGVIATLKRASPAPDGSLQIDVETRSRGQLLSLDDEPYLHGEVEPLQEDPIEDPELARVLPSEVRQAFTEYAGRNKNLKLERRDREAVEGTEDPGELADLVARLSGWSVSEKVEILALNSVEARLRLVLSSLLRDIEQIRTDNRIAKKVKEQIDQNQREYYLKEQLRAIQRELAGGEKSETESLREKIEAAGMPAAVQEKALRELNRLEQMPPASPEASVIRNYIDWLLAVPWQEKNEEILDLGHTQATLEQQHYGLSEVKARILEFLAVRRLAGSSESNSSILCLVGPPGVGKTSLGRSVAESMNRKFVRMSLGGVHDEAEIRGHRRTYIGALPGRIIQGMRSAGTINPLFLLDEVDKLGADYRGDPASALLEVLDPEQNRYFEDHYLEVPYDLSQVFFITTANTTQTIPRPLLDRMEVIEIPGYTRSEKREIALRYLWPKQTKGGGLEAKLALSPEAIEQIITLYTREAGVRNLERELAKLVRKEAKIYLESPWNGERKLTEVELPELLGIPRFRPDRRELEPQVGAAQGLAWTPVGGVLLTVEAVAVPGSGKLSLTGNLGEVMKESAQAAITYLRAHAEDWGLPADFYQKWDVHIHVPEGATPKEGPSAGITIATAVASALTGRAARMDIAMTGEITLRGKVLAIGGVKEKLLAAHQAGIHTVILPEEDSPYLAEVPEEVRSELEVHWVHEVGEVFTLVLGDQPALNLSSAAPATIRPEA